MERVDNMELYEDVEISQYKIDEIEENGKRIFEMSFSNCRNEMPPIYYMFDFKFDVNTRIANIIFEKLVKYRTIDRYVTRNYIRNPVYSKWKYKLSTITKNIKLSNAVLENLQNNSDELIRVFANEIIDAIDDATLTPFWYKESIINDKYNTKNKELLKEEKNQMEMKNKKYEWMKSDIEEFSLSANIIKNKINVLEIKIIKKKAKYEKSGRGKKKLDFILDQKKQLDIELMRLTKRIQELENQLSELTKGSINVKKEILKNEKKENRKLFQNVD